MLSCIELFINHHAIAIESVTAILTTIATLYISYLTYKNIKESRRATIMADEKKNVIEACKYAIQFTSLIEKLELLINVSKEKCLTGAKMYQKRINKEFQEELFKIEEQISSKVTELRTVSAFLPEECRKQIDWLQCYYKSLQAYLRCRVSRFTKENIGFSNKYKEVKDLENLNAIDCKDALNSLESKLKEKGFSTSKMLFESLQTYFHENIKKVIAEKKFSLHNLEKVWITYKQFIKQEENNLFYNQLTF
ncbi:hypothetical protein HPDP_00182 [Candidatus Hepatincola sp. Pdp]